MEQLQLLEIIKFIHLQDQVLLKLSSAGILRFIQIDYLVVAGGGGGGVGAGGGGGAGGFRESVTVSMCTSISINGNPW